MLQFMFMVQLLVKFINFSFKSYGKESLYKYCMNVDDGRIMRSWGSCLLTKESLPKIQIQITVFVLLLLVK